MNDRGRVTKCMGLTRLGEIPPPRFCDVEQRVIAVDPDRPLEPQLPRACPKCRSEHTLELRGRELHCAGSRGGCGATYYLVSRASVPLAMDGRGRAAHHQTARWAARRLA